MKKLFSALLLLLLTVTFTACNAPGGTVCQHRDANDDGKCDKCDEDYTDGTDVVTPCQHRDADDNGKCDNCTEDYSDGTDSEVCQHRDADDNGKCDNCTEDYSDGTDSEVCQHRDADDDGKCDKCTEDYSDGTDNTHSHTFGDWILYGDATNTPCQDRLFYRTCPSCGDIEWKNGGYEAHAFTTVTFAPTCTAEGYDEKTCSICGLVETVNQKPMAEHDYKTVYTTNASFHWLECKNCDATKAYAEHTANGSICTVCEAPLAPTEGIVYDLSADGTYAEVIAYSGTATKVLIADTYQGVPVTNIYREAFKNTSITEVIIPDSVTTIGGHAFYRCSSLTSVTIGDSVTSIGQQAFCECYNLTSVTIGNSVTTIGDSAFHLCSSLTSVTIGNSVTTIGAGAFSSCDSLTSVTIPDSVTTIGGSAFRDCSSLTSVTIGSSVTEIGYNAFYSCNSALYTEYEYGKYVGDSENPYQVLIEITNKNLSTYQIHEDTKIIAYGVFMNCARLTSITIPDSVTSIGEEAFSGCTSLTIMTIPDSVTSIGNFAFCNCDSLTSVTIPDSVTSIGYEAFYGCDSLTSVTISDSVTSISSWAFCDCSSLTSVYYKGTAEEWNEISIGSSNSQLTNATRYYYSETAPTEEGNYWHYDANGEIEIWP